MPQTIIRAIIYLGAGAVLFAVVFCLVALVPFLNLDPQAAAKVGALVGLLAGFVLGLTRRFA